MPPTSFKPEVIYLFLIAEKSVLASLSPWPVLLVWCSGLSSYSLSPLQSLQNEELGTDGAKYIYMETFAFSESSSQPSAHGSAPGSIMRFPPAQSMRLPLCEYANCVQEQVQAGWWNLAAVLRVSPPALCFSFLFRPVSGMKLENKRLAPCSMCKRTHLWESFGPPLAVWGMKWRELSNQACLALHQSSYSGSVRHLLWVSNACVCCRDGKGTPNASDSRKSLRYPTSKGNAKKTDLSRVFMPYLSKTTPGLRTHSQGCLWPFFLKQEDFLVTGKPPALSLVPDFYGAPKVGTYDEWMRETFILIHFSPWKCSRKDREQANLSVCVTHAIWSSVGSDKR